MIETRVVEEPRVRAVVKSAHISALKARLRPKKDARIRNSTTLLVLLSPKAVEIALAQLVVSSVVVSLAKTPLKAAHAPLAMAKAIQGVFNLLLTTGRSGRTSGGMADGRSGSAEVSIVDGGAGERCRSMEVNV